MGKKNKGVLPLEKLSLIKITDPFQRNCRNIETLEYRRGESLLDLRIRTFCADVPVVVSLNGSVVPTAELALTFPAPNDQVLMVPEIQGGGGGGGKNVIRAVLMVIVAVVATIVTAGGASPLLGAAFASGTTGAVIAGACVMVIGGMLVNALVPAPKPKAAGNDLPGIAGNGYETTQTYTWSPTTLQEPGLPIPRVYGTHKVMGNIIGGYIADGFKNDQYANLLIAICIGPIHCLRDFYINDQPVSNFRGVETVVTPGKLNQSPSTTFYHTPVAHGLSLGLSTGAPAYWTTPNNDFDALEIEIQWPAGLYRQANEQEAQQMQQLVQYYPQYASTMSPTAPQWVHQKVSIQVRRVGDADWIPITQEAVTTGTEVAVGHWSLGAYVQNAAWYYEANGGIYWLNPDTNQYEFLENAYLNVSPFGGGPTIVYYDSNGNMIVKQPSQVWIEAERGSGVRTDHFEGEQVWFGQTKVLPSGQIYYLDSCNWHWIDDGFEIVYATEIVPWVTISRAVAEPVRCLWRKDFLPKGQYEISVSVNPPTQNKSTVSDKSYLSSIKEIYYDVFTYPRLATVALHALATEQLNGSIRFSCICDGALVWQYVGGQWLFAWSDNPAWVMYDILTQPVTNDTGTAVLRYDAYRPENIDTAAFVRLANFCNELVPDGFGGTEKRFTFNGVFDGEKSVWESALTVGSMCRAVPFFLGTKVTLAIDAPTEATQLFTVGNIGIDSFEETFLPMEERAAEITIDYTDRDNRYERTTLSVIHNDLNSIANKTGLQPFGITKRSEAWRCGMYQLANNLYIKRTASLRVHIDALASTLGDVALVQHDVPRWGYGGRLSAATLTEITLDKEVQIEPGKTYALMLRLADDTIITRSITNTPSITNVLTLSAPVGTIAEPMDVIYAFGESTKIAKPFRIVGVQPEADFNFTLKLAEYNESIYTCDDLIPMLETPNYAIQPAYAPVSGLTLKERLRKRSDGSLTNSIVVSWTIPADSNYNYAEVYFRTGGGPWQCVGDVTGSTWEIPDVLDGGMYEVAVCTVTHVLAKMPIAQAPRAYITVIGAKAPPSDVERLDASQQGTIITLRWPHVPDVDLWGYEIRTGATWDSARVVVDGVQQNFCTILVERNGTTRWLIKAVDGTNVYSINAASVDFNVVGIDLNEIISQNDMTKTPPADGTLANLIYVPEYHALMFFHSLTDADLINAYDSDFADRYDTIVSAGSYTTAPIDALQLGRITIRIVAALDASNTVVYDSTYPTRHDSDYPYDTDDHITAPSMMQLSYRVSNDLVTWSSWRPYVQPEELEFRYAQVKVDVATDSETVRLKLTDLTTILDVPDNDFTITGLAVAATTGTDVLYSTYGKSFFGTPTPMAQVIGATTPKLPVISNVTQTGFHIDLLDTSGAKVAGNVNIDISGY